MSRKKIAEYAISDMDITYLQDEDTGIVGLQLLPIKKLSMALQDKDYKQEPLIQVKVIGDDYPFGFSQGRTMRNSESVQKMKYVKQDCESLNEDTSRIVTFFKDDRGLKYEHILTFNKQSDALEFSSSISNCGSKPVTIEMMSSFTLGAITPFIDKEAEESLILHRILSTWSAEGRLVSTPVEELQLEPSWQKCSANSIRFGQIGSMPVRGYFPFVAVEDIKTGVTWAAQLTHASSWQIEAYRRDDALVLSGGIADREFGHWLKTLEPGETFVTPKAVLTVVCGNVDAAAGRITENMRKALDLPESEKSMPVIFNEFCTTWGNPEEKIIKQMAEKLQGKGIEYFVIDAGWFLDEKRGWDRNIGEWVVSKSLFPSGMGKAVENIRKCNMKPGIWFEFEVSARDSVTFNWSDMLLKRDGIPITSGDRRFWDMRKKEVQDYLTKKVIGFLREYGFEYLKVDYNENIGIGCEGSESLGEGLRQQIMATQSFFKRIHTEMPQLVIETCSSGGHRHVPSFLEISSMASFSDAHECDEIPIIAANMHRMMLPRQSQIWAVFRVENPLKKFYYQIASTCLGRFCVSGDINSLTEEQWNIVQSGIDFYKKVADIIEKGTSERFGNHIISYRKAKGWQGVVRTNFENTKKLIVIHTFNQYKNDIQIPLDGKWTVSDCFIREGINLEISKNILRIAGADDFDGIAILLKK